MRVPFFIKALAADKPAAARSDKMKLYGWLIGRWTMDATLYLDDGGTYRGTGEIYFGWVLEGRAIQDVWILPGVFHGTTLRVYDPAIDAWHILWSDPLRQFYVRQVGKAQGDDIVQVGADEAGQSVRWSFSDITPATFRWRGERSRNGGESWQLQAEFLARRVVTPNSFHREEELMIDHISIGVRDIARTKRFYDAALKPLGYTCLSEGQGSLGYGKEAVTLWISSVERPVPADPKSGLHFCFAAPTRRSIEAFHTAALNSGGHDNGPPGLRTDYGPNYYAAFVIDPDGYRLEAYCGDSS